MQLTEDLSRFKGTVILVSHNRDEAYRMSNKIIVIKNGRCMAPMDKEQLFDDPHTVDAAVVSGCKNILPAVKVDDHHVKVISWDMELETENKVPDDLDSVGIRSHYITEKVNGNKISCIVRKIIESPFEYSVLLSVDTVSGSDNEKQIVSLHWQIDKSHSALAVGDNISLYVPDDKILLLV